MKTIITLVAGLAASTTFAQDIALRPDDAVRLDQFDAHFGLATRQALAEGTPADVATLTAALQGRARGINPAGDWLCRTIKMGGGVPLVVYRNFQCRITENGDGSFTLEKLTGSQRMRGTFAATEEGRLVYAGVGYVGDAPAVDYADFPDETASGWVDPGQTVPQVGVFEITETDAARLMLPDPILESDFDLLVLSR